MPVLNLPNVVQQAAREAGFDRVGVSPVSRFPELEYFPSWIDDQRHGEMRYLETREAGGELKRVAVERVFPWAHSVIVGAMNYNSGAPHSVENVAPEASPSVGHPASTPRGWISRYAWPARDYHDEILERLRHLEKRLHEAAGPDLQTRCYVDTGPLVERIYGRYAGIGWLGKNTCIIDERLGSWLFLGVILTSLQPAALTGTAPAAPAPDRCGTCTRCLDACPTQAFLGPHRLDASRCISYLTIEKRGMIPEELRLAMGRHVFGCDICQEVCPWNRQAPVTLLPALEPQPELVNPDLSWLATIGEEEFQKRFRHSPIGRAKRTGLRRNAVIAMGNSGEAGFLPLLRSLANDPDAVIATHAQWAIGRLQVKNTAG